jgi:hypothetical protein
MHTRYTSPTADGAGLFLAAALVLASTAARAQGDNLGNHSAIQNLGLNDFDLRLRAGTDGNHGLGWYGSAASTKNWLGQTVDGPVLYGYTSGVLGTNRSGTRTSVLTWNYLGNVGIGTNAPQARLDVRGNVKIAGINT